MGAEKGPDATCKGEILIGPDMLIDGAPHLDGCQLLDESAALFQLPGLASACMQPEHLWRILLRQALDEVPAARNSIDSTRIGHNQPT